VASEIQSTRIFPGILKIFAGMMTDRALIGGLCRNFRKNILRDAKVKSQSRPIRHQDGSSRMRVDDRNLTGAATGSPERTQGTQSLERSGRFKGASSRTGTGSDLVELSSLSRALNSSSSSSSARVAQLAGQYQSGQYQVDAAQVSHSMVIEALQASASTS
jgi:anti-sigma28 factor (negative regulator of flagellin synthesis)